MIWDRSGAFVAVGSLCATGARQAEQPERSRSLQGKTLLKKSLKLTAAAPRLRARKPRASAAGLGPRALFLLLPSFSFPPSYTHRPWFTRSAAPSRSGVRAEIPTKSFVWEKFQIDSRPPSPSPGPHASSGLGRERPARRRPSTYPILRPTLYLDLPYTSTYPILRPALYFGPPYTYGHLGPVLRATLRRNLPYTSAFRPPVPSRGATL